MGKWWKQWETLFFGLQNHCSHKIKRCLCLGRKAMTNLDSVLKSKDITWPTKGCLIKAMVFLAVMHGCELDHKEGWVLKNWCFELWCWRRLLRVPWTARKSTQSILKEMLKLKLQYFGHLMRRTDSLEKTRNGGKDWRWEQKGMREDEMVGWHHWLNRYEFEQAPGDGEGKESLACCSPWGHKESDKTVWLNNNNYPSFFSPINTYQALMCKLEKKK